MVPSRSTDTRPAFKLSELESMFEHVGVADAAEFASYLRDILTHQPGETSSETNKKASFLKSILLDCGDPSASYHAFHLTIYLVSHLGPLAFERPTLPWSPAQDGKPYCSPDKAYWDAAKLRREVYSAYQSHDCEQEDTSDPLDETTAHSMQEHCFHARNIVLLQNLQERAQLEIR